MFPRASLRCRYPGRLVLSTRDHRTKPQASGLSLPNPGHRGLGRLARRLVLTVAPVTARALFVMRGPASGADHEAIFRWQFPGPLPGPRLTSGPRRMAAGGIDHLEWLSGVGAAHPAAPFRGPLLFIQAAPGAVLFRPGNGVGEAFRLHRARGADGLRLALAHFALRLPLPVRAEEEHDVLASARGGVLPGPTRPWRHSHLPTYLRHELVSSISSVCAPASKPRAAGRAVSRVTSVHPVYPSNAPCRPHVPAHTDAHAAQRAGKIGGNQGTGREGRGCAPAIPAKPAGPAEPTLNCAIRGDRSAAGRENQAGPTASAMLLVADK